MSFLFKKNSQFFRGIQNDIMILHYLLSVWYKSSEYIFYLVSIYVLVLKITINPIIRKSILADQPIIIGLISVVSPIV